MGTANADDEVLDATADEGDGPAEDSNSLTSIDVFNNGFGPQGMGILANAMISSTTVSLERLYIGSNRLGPGMPFSPSSLFFFDGTCDASIAVGLRDDNGGTTGVTTVRTTAVIHFPPGPCFPADTINAFRLILILQAVPRWWAW